MKKSRVTKTETPLAIKLISFLNYAGALSSLVILYSLFFNLAGEFLSFNSSLHTFFLGGVGSFLFILYFGAGFVGSSLNVYFILLILYSIFLFILAESLLRGKTWARTVQVVLSVISILLLLWQITIGFDLLSFLVILLNAIILLYLLFNKTVKDFFESSEKTKLIMSQRMKILGLVIVYMFIIILIFNFIYLSEKQFRLNPSQEIVMSKGMEITATTSEGTIKILAEDNLKRTYTWENCVRSQILSPRQERQNGILGAYFYGPNPIWKECNDIDGAILEEGQLHFSSVDGALEWIKKDASVDISPKVYNDDGLLIVFYKGGRGDLQVQVWQILINGSKPSKLEGSDNSKISINYKP